MKRFDLPLSESAIKSLHAGDIVEISGTIYTARDAAHKRICAALENGEKPPVDLKDAAIYYCGPTPAREGEIIGSCGPTTSGRMDDYAPTLLAQGALVTIGKGKRSAEVIAAIQRYCGVYLAAVGGAGALMKSYVTKCELVAYEDLGCEAIYRLTVKDMQLMVAADCYGKTVLR